MSRIRGKMPPAENIGLVDRMVRFFGGGALMTFGVMSAVLTGHSVISAAAILLAVYPLMTTVMGWDPFYQLFGARTCTLEGGRNQCGTLPYELDSALGHEPKPEEGYDYDHSLTGSHRETKRKAAA
jgi:Inner membrane protein YgaP-like, transmembrane domain